MFTKRFFSILIAIAGFFVSVNAKNAETSFEESLELRRIAEYWKEKDYPTVKIQIREFLSKNPKSAFTDQLCSMLGDLHFQEKDFKGALEAYDKIQDKEYRQKCQFHRLHCLYETDKHEELILSSDRFFKDPNAKSDEINAIRFELAEAYFHKALLPENEVQKKELCKLALVEYQQLMQTKFSEMTLLQQAQIYAFLEEHSKAASLYLLLANKDLSKKEEYLFHAATLQLHGDKKSAIETFASIHELNGKYASKAAFNQLNLLYQEKHYRAFILAQDKALRHISAEKMPLIQYYLGKSLVHVGDFARAVDPLSQSLAAKSLDRVQEKSALMSLIVCAKETQDLLLFDKTLAHLKKEFANDEETATILLMHAQICRDKKDWAKALVDIKEILEISPSHSQREALLFDSALLLLQEGKWHESSLAFEAFVKEFPQSVNKAPALRHIVNCRMEDIRHASKATEGVKKELLVSALNEALEDSKTFSSSERQKIRYLQAKTHFEMNMYDEAIGELSEYIRDFQKDATSSDAYLLLAYSYLKGSQDEIHFVLNAEKALALNPQLQGAVDLHLTLFNTYLGLAGKSSVDEKAEMIDKAAVHLFLALDKPVSKENLRWLAGYYFQRYQNGKSADVERTAIVLEKLLDINPSSIALSIPSQSLDMEAEAIKLADIYGKTGRMKEKTKLLEALSKEHKAHPDYHWKYQRMAAFELGKTYLALNEKESALNAFEALISSSSHTTSYFATAAQLENAKLKFSMLKASERSEDSKALMAICDTLKEIQIKRKLHSEPLHLEAALCYVDIKTELASSDQKRGRKRFLLEQTKESFSSETDPLVRQYFSAASQFPDKERLYRQYMALIDAELLRLEAEENQNSVLSKEAKGKLNTLLTEVSDESLKQRICQIKDAI